MDNKFPGKDITETDLKNKFPLCAKKNSGHFSSFEVAGIKFGKELVIFAGPNMVESRELIFDVAKNVKESGAQFLRGGAFKPLTFPYRSKKYNETREDGIRWLAEAKEKLKMTDRLVSVGYKFVAIDESTGVKKKGAKQNKSIKAILNAVKMF